MTHEWNESISVGDATIDAQHKRLLAQIRKLEKAIEQGAGEAIEDILKFLAGYILKHLAYEEAYMKAHAYPKFEEHKAIHMEFIHNFVDMREDYEQKRIEKFREAALTFLGSWWIAHIAGADQNYESYIKKHESCHPEGEPKDYHVVVQDD